MTVKITAGTVVERNYKISNMERYQDQNFLDELDQITFEEGISILKRTIDKDTDSVKIQARFDSEHWDVCKALHFLSVNGISVSPIGEFDIIAESNECTDEVRITIKKMKEVIDA